MIRALIAAGVAGLAVASADAAVTLTFADPPGGREVSYTAPNPGDTFGVLNAVATVNLSIDLSVVTGDVADVLTFNGASFVHSAELGALSIATPFFSEAPLANGSFSFVDAGGDLILAATYDMGATFLFGPAGAVTQANPDSNLVFTVGPAYVNALPASLLAGGFTALEAIDSSFTLTSLLFAAGGQTVVVDGDTYFNSFQANSAYTGTANVVPAPGAIAFAGLGGLLAARRRRAS